jgi:hypothetical protein
MNQPATFDLTDDPAPRRRVWPFVVWTAAVAVYGAVLHGQVHLPVPSALMNAAVYIYTLALLMVPVARVSQRLASRRLPTSLLVARHLVVAGAAIAIWVSVNVLFLRLTVGPAMWELVLADAWMFQVLSSVAYYGAALGIVLAVQGHDRERRRERREAELTIVAREAELAAIKAQLQPHFVLNALNSLLVLIDKDPALARAMVTRLSDLMKAVFDRFDVVQVPLAREIDLIRAYLDIERIRFGPRLSVVFDVDEASAHAMVPAFVLQPIVENAVRHGIAPHARPGEIRVSTRMVDGRVRVTVRDSGVAPAANFAAEPHAGRGLQLTRRRLDAVYGSEYRLSFDREDDGLAVCLDLPMDAAHAG